MKMMQGAILRACSNRSRTRAAPTPTNISTNSEPLIEKNGTPASPATARASSVLPVPGGPTSSTPLRHARAEPAVALRVLQEVDDLLQLGLGLVDAGDVGEAWPWCPSRRRSWPGSCRSTSGRRAPMPPAAMRRSRNIQMPKKISAGSTQDSSVVKKF